MGTAGVTSAMFSFDVPLTEYPDYTTAFPGGAEVVLSCMSKEGYANYSRTFYVSSKSADDTKISVKCYDRSIYTECDFPCEDTDFTDSDGNEIKMNINTVLTRIAGACGFSMCGVGADVETDFELPKSILQGRSCHDVLNSVSVLLCGYWVYQDTDSGMHLIAIGSTNNFTNSVYALKHEKLRQTSSIQINSVYMTNGAEICGGNAGGTDTVTIDSAAATKELYSEVSGRFTGYLYGGYSCDNALLSAVTAFPLLINFEGEDTPLYANYCDIKISSSGILASCGCNTVDEGAWTYKTRTKRELEKKYSEGDTWTNTEITKSGGIKMVYVNENGGKEKYGVTVKNKGVTVYDGNAVSKYPAEKITVSDNADSVEYITANGVKAALELVWNGDILTSFKRRFTDENGKEIFDDDKENENV